MHVKSPPDEIECPHKGYDIRAGFGWCFHTPRSGDLDTGCTSNCYFTVVFRSLFHMISRWVYSLTTHIHKLLAVPQIFNFLFTDVWDSLPAKLSQVFLTLLISDRMYSCSYGPKCLKKPQFCAWVVCLDYEIYCTSANHGSSPIGPINQWLLQSLYMTPLHPLQPVSRWLPVAHLTRHIVLMLCGLTNIILTTSLNPGGLSSILYNICGTWR